MNSFNDLNGIPATADKYLQREILKGDWNFDGFVVSDWGSLREMMDHGFARDRKHAGELALNGGSDKDMESYITSTMPKNSSKKEKLPKSKSTMLFGEYYGKIRIGAV